jgi:hypothetical protein
MPKKLTKEEPGDPNAPVLLQGRLPRWIKNRAIVASSQRGLNLTAWLSEAILTLTADQEQGTTALVPPNTLNSQAIGGSRRRELPATARRAVAKRSRRTERR